MDSRPQCDIIMKGGVTSGIVYPLALFELNETFRFRSIGGTSAGAIAAGFAAAATYGQEHEAEAPFERLRDLPDRLGTKVGAFGRGPTRLAALFQPAPATRGAFRVLMSAATRRSLWAALAWTALKLPTEFWGWAALGGALGAMPGLMFSHAGLPERPASLVLAWVFFAAVAGGGALAAAAGGMLFRVTRSIPRNHYGLCSGLTESRRGWFRKAPPPALTDWLHGMIQELAGLEPGRPLTFSDLWGPGSTEGQRDIELVLMTTNVTDGVSHRFPFVEREGPLYFDEQDMRSLFPPCVVEHLLKRGRARRETQQLESEGRSVTLIPLPAPEDLPVVVGVRFSLSFPVLLSAIPLYKLNSRRGQPAPVRMWFSDGGLTSNFPIHFFDSTLPTRPTFAINLAPARVIFGQSERAGEVSNEEMRGEECSVWMPKRNSDGATTRSNPFDRNGPNLASFLGAVLDTALNWNDTEMMALPGYRDRIAHVPLRKHEGSLNLNMKPEVIRDVAERGQEAARLLTARMGPHPGTDPETGRPHVLSWRNHRWVRFRTWAAASEAMIREFVDRFERGNYLELLEHETPPSYPWHSPAQGQHATETTVRLVQTMRAWKEPHQSFLPGPQPPPDLRLAPRGLHPGIAHGAKPL